ncbi:Exocyst complex component EXO84 [Wallemia ichthyophaga EXF-994]|uniref:Exocyst complex component EXO84 n=1 Tax=Wallemia ichthyophaga (strain EXF-994 / CBS 113033) TaxID=1299270 RepID=R9AFS5_WALI9|nr:Exocyst complex component EXO84 [Wallemia ichthyophaga EXF-994]EOR01027.1 Exocyst complex component EXO84 [Wallemia ichthyophaga EXF-994]
MSKQRVSRKSLRRPTTFYGASEEIPPMPRQSMTQEDLPATTKAAAPIGAKKYKPKAHAKDRKEGKDSENDSKTRLGEKLKKRLSVKYTYQQPKTRTVGSAPPVPSLPSTHIPNQKQTPQTEDVRESLLEDIDENRVSQVSQVDADIDIINREWLQQPDFDAQAYIRTHLANASEDEVEHFKQALTDAMQSTNLQLEQSAFKNYADFIAISKEIGALETEVLELRELLGEWRSLPEAFGVENVESDLETTKKKRSSVADLAAVYRTQLQTLHSTVEGSLKHVPHAPGRHVVTTASKFVELNAATYRVAQSVEMVLLNDTLLIASKRRRQASGGREKLIADRAWSLSEINIQDLRDSIKVTNSIKVKHNKQSYVYMAESPSDKNVFLNAVKQVAEEYQAQMEQQQHNQEGDLSPNFIISPSIASIQSTNSPLRTPISSSNKHLQWMEDFIDELSVSVAVNDHHAAVEHVEQGRKMLRSTDDKSEREALQAQIAHQKGILVRNLLRVVDDFSRLREHVLVDVISLLHRLDEAGAGRDTYLNSRKELIKHRSRQMVFDGDVVNYVAELAVITFTIIKQSAEWFRAAFINTNKASGYGNWASEQIKTFAVMFRRQVYGSHLGKSIIERAIQVTHEQGQRILKEVQTSTDLCVILNKQMEEQVSPSLI